MKNWRITYVHDGSGKYRYFVLSAKNALDAFDNFYRKFPCSYTITDINQTK